MLTEDNKNSDKNNSNELFYNLLRQIIDLLKNFDEDCRAGSNYPISKEGFMMWITENHSSELRSKEKGNTAN